VSQITTEI